MWSEAGRVSLTNALARVFTLVSASVDVMEPVLLVGGTGCGKTTACQLLAERLGRTLYILNCHQHTETSDILGGLRPVRGRERSLGLFREGAHQLMMLLSSRQTSSTNIYSVDSILSEYADIIQLENRGLSQNFGQKL